MRGDRHGDQLDEQLRALRAALNLADLTMEQLWTRYFALGGEAGPTEVDAFLHGLTELPVQQRDILAHAVNEWLGEQAPIRRVPYSRVTRDASLDNRTLRALVGLIEGTHLAPPDRLPAAAAAAAGALNLDLTIYLIDYGQRALHPYPANDGLAPLAVDTTLAGRAFRLVQAMPVRGEHGRRLWVPLLDGVERLGVLEVVPRDNTDLNDPGLRVQCRWLATLLGHLITINTELGDSIDAVRLQRPRTTASELIWQLLPPLTSGMGNFVLAGMLEPCYEIGGDTFDYSMSETTAWLAIFDAVGHTLNSGLIAAAALAAYRGTRRAGHGLDEQARAIDETIAHHFPGGSFVTGVLAELDLTSGRLRYINAGHPRPLLLRSGKIVKSLGQGHRRPFGLGVSTVVPGTETLQTADWLVLFTDGITEARDDDGRFFGEARLVDFLEREAAAGYPPPETVRRLIHAVMAHQNGVLQDDATVLLARWLAAPRDGVDHEVPDPFERSKHAPD